MNWHADDSNFARMDRPIVMACLGAAASFGYKLQSRDRDREVRLESGDVIVFGGPARSLVHALLRVYPGTAPSELQFPGDLAGGRVSVTWRDVGPEDGLVFNSDERLGLIQSLHALPRYRSKLGFVPPERRDLTRQQRATGQTAYPKSQNDRGATERLVHSSPFEDNKLGHQRTPSGMGTCATKASSCMQSGKLSKGWGAGDGQFYCEECWKLWGG